jgi:hypothetical protein
LGDGKALELGYQLPGGEPENEYVMLCYVMLWCPFNTPASAVALGVVAFMFLAVLFTPISMTGHGRRYPALTRHWPSITSH